MIGWLLPYPMLLECQSVQKRFGGIVALRNGTLRVGSGQVHLLMGENGAGKSTLMKIVAGLQRRDGGQMLFQGRPVDFRSPAEASANGIAMVHQESLLAPHLSVAENIFLGREPRKPGGFVDRKQMQTDAVRLIAEHRFPLRAEQRVESLSPAGRQLVEICRAIQHGTSLLIFDEPTSSLSEAEAQAVSRIVRTLKERGAGVIYITHRLEELRTVGDHVTVLRDGQTVHTAPLAELTKEALVRHMVGRELNALYRRAAVTPGKELLRAHNVTRRPVVRDVSLSLRAGEIVGLGGLIGAGRTELCRALFGLDPIESGHLWIDGQEVRIRHPREAVAAGLALIPEDRQRTGLATQLPVGDNMTLAALPSVTPWGLLNGRAAEEAVRSQIGRLRIKTNGSGQIAGRLSGGNQQKVVIGKWLAQGARIFLFDEPTRGIDVGAKVEVFEVMDQLAREGAAILMVSSELPELLQVADRILVMREGRISAELPGNTTQEEIMHWATPEEIHVTQ